MEYIDFDTYNFEQNKRQIGIQINVSSDFNWSENE